MVEFTKKLLKDLGLQREVVEALPYANVGGAWEGSFDSPLSTQEDIRTVLSHVVPHGQQLKLLFLRVWTQESGGAVFSIVQSNPTEEDQTGDVEAYPVRGSVPEGVRDYPMLEAAGAEVLRGSLNDPVHVLEGSITFNIVGPTPSPATGSKYGFVWWGVEKIPEQREE
jgi:hypothetical protein